MEQYNDKDFEMVRDAFWEFQKHRLESEPEDGDQFYINWYVWQRAWAARGDIDSVYLLEVRREHT